MELFRAIHEKLRDKAADELYAHLLLLGIDVQLVRKHPLQKVSKGMWGGGRKSLGLVQVAGRNISYVNVIREAHETGSVYYLEYLVPLKDMPSSLCQAELDMCSAELETSNIEWRGGTLAERLNDDPTLKESLLMEFGMNEPLKIEIYLEPDYQCGMMETTRGNVLPLPSRSLFDCLDRIAGCIPEHLTEVTSRPERVLLEAKVEVNPDSKDAEVVDCYVTDRHVIIESKERLKITLYQIEDCHVSTPLPSFGAAMAEVSYSTVTLRYLDESGRSRKVEFAMQTFDAGSLCNIVRRYRPMWHKPMRGTRNHHSG